MYYERDLYSENADSPVKCIHFNKTKTKYVKGYDVEVNSLDGVVDLNMNVEEGQSVFRSFTTLHRTYTWTKEALACFLFSKSFSYISFDI